MTKINLTGGGNVESIGSTITKINVWLQLTREMFLNTFEKVEIITDLRFD
jgi:hypothetical protein